MTPREARRAVAHGRLKIHSGKPPIPADEQQFRAMRQRFGFILDDYFLTLRGRPRLDGQGPKLVFTLTQVPAVRRTIPLAKAFLNGKSSTALAKKLGISATQVKHLVARGVNYMLAVDHLEWVDKVDGGKPHAERTAAVED